MYRAQCWQAAVSLSVSKLTGCLVGEPIIFSAGLTYQACAPCTQAWIPSAVTGVLFASPQLAISEQVLAQFRQKRCVIHSIDKHKTSGAPPSWHLPVGCSRALEALLISSFTTYYHHRPVSNCPSLTLVHHAAAKPHLASRVCQAEFSVLDPSRLGQQSDLCFAFCGWSAFDAYLCQQEELA